RRRPVSVAACRRVDPRPSGGHCRHAARPGRAGPHAAEDVPLVVSGRPYAARAASDAARPDLRAGAAHYEPAGSMPLLLRSSPVRGPDRNFTSAVAASLSFAALATPAA